MHHLHLFAHLFFLNTPSSLIPAPVTFLCVTKREKENKPKMSNVRCLITQEAYQAVTFQPCALVVFLFTD